MEKEDGSTDEEDQRCGGEDVSVIHDDIDKDTVKTNSDDNDDTIIPFNSIFDSDDDTYVDLDKE